MKTFIALLLAAGVAHADEPIVVEGSLGDLDQESVQRAVDEHADALEVCFRSQAEKMRHLGGDARLRVKIGRDGAVKKAWVDEGDLGSWAAEKCFIARVHKMSFGRPRGGDAVVEVPLQFIAWMPADPGDAAELEKKLPKAVAKCAGAPDEVAVTVYVGPGGRVKSTGFTGEVDEAWADCAVKKIGAVRLRDPRGRMLKMTGRLAR